MSKVFNDQVIFNDSTQTYGNSFVSNDLTAENINAVGIITATTYYGDGSNLSNINVVVTQVGYSSTNPILTSGKTISIGSTSNAYGTRYISVGSTPGASAGSNGDIWYVV